MFFFSLKDQISSLQTEITSIKQDTVSAVSSLAADVTNEKIASLKLEFDVLLQDMQEKLSQAEVGRMS